MILKSRQLNFKTCSFIKLQLKVYFLEINMKDCPLKTLLAFENDCYTN